MMEGNPSIDPDRLRRMLGPPQLAWLLDRIRRRLELDKPLTGPVTLANATREQRRAIERLLGRPAGAGVSLTVSLDDVDAVLRTSGAAPDGLEMAVPILLGAVPSRAARAAAESSAWSLVHAPLDELVGRRPELASWRGWLDSTGLLRRLAPEPGPALELVAQLVRVLEALPSDGVAFGRLAAAATGTAHGLDDGRPLATLALGAARAIAGGSPTGDGSAAGRREAWAAVGVHRDELSSSVLCLGLPGSTDTVTGRILALGREAGEPAVLTLRQLGRERSGLGVGADRVWLCENPIVLASAADELGSRCPPLVCVNGQPSVAVQRLLRQLDAEGARFSYHGDFDWGGLRIANGLGEQISWSPWRFDAGAYHAARTTVCGGELSGRPVAAAWDPELRPALEHHGVRIEEEHVLADLLGDLAADSR